MDPQACKLKACCDNPGCSGENALQRCSKCKCVYYCDSKCQKLHWKAHKVECKAFCANAENIVKKELELEQFSNRNEKSVGEECCICFSPMKDIDVMQWKCQHIFCVECSILLQRSDRHPALYAEMLILVLHQMICMRMLLIFWVLPGDTQLVAVCGYGIVLCQIVSCTNSL